MSNFVEYIKLSVSKSLTYYKYQNSYWSPKAPIMATTAYGVQAATNKKQIVIAAFAILTSADWAFASWLLRKDSTFIFLA